MKMIKSVAAAACTAALAVALVPAGMALAEGGMDYTGDPWGDAYSRYEGNKEAEKPAVTPENTETNENAQPESSTFDNWATDLRTDELPYATEDMVKNNEPFRPISEGTGIYNTDINSELDMNYDQLSDYYYYKLINSMGRPDLADGVWKPYTMDELQSVVKRERFDMEAEQAWTQAAEKYLAEHNAAVDNNDEATTDETPAAPAEQATTETVEEAAPAAKKSDALPSTSDVLATGAGALASIGSAAAAIALKLRKL